MPGFCKDDQSVVVSDLAFVRKAHDELPLTDHRESFDRSRTDSLLQATSNMAQVRDDAEGSGHSC